MQKRPHVAIVGGGIGGTALAVSLLQRDVDVRVFERAPSFMEVGAGIQMTPNAVKVVAALGLDRKLAAAGFLPQRIVGRNWKSGRENFSTALRGEFPRLYGAPYIQVHRADLLELFTAQLPAHITEFGKQASQVRSTPDGAIVEFTDGTSHAADLVVGADGVRSTIRAALFGEEAPRYTGHMCFRALVPVGGIVDYVSPDNAMWMGPHGHVVTYYVRGGTMVNIVAVAESPNWVEESWNVRSTPAALKEQFQGWHPDLMKLFSEVEDVYRWGLFDRDPMPRWSDGRVTLLGDAAHPMLPFLSQGAATAIEDGYVLAAALAANPADIPRALRLYESERLPRTGRVQLELRQRGETYHLPSLWSQVRRDIEYRLRSIFAPQTTGIRANWVYEYDATRFAGARADPEMAG